jgi:DNA-binding transcriptional regulator PaaX
VAGVSDDNPPWLVLAYRVPGETARLRAALSRRLKRAGAVYLAPSVAVLPDSPAGERLLRRLRSQVRDMGGSAQVLRAEA